MARKKAAPTEAKAEAPPPAARKVQGNAKRRYAMTRSMRRSAVSRRGSDKQQVDLAIGLLAQVVRLAVLQAKKDPGPEGVKVGELALWATPLIDWLKVNGVKTVMVREWLRELVIHYQEKYGLAGVPSFAKRTFDGARGEANILYGPIGQRTRMYRAMPELVAVLSPTPGEMDRRLLNAKALHGTNEPQLGHMTEDEKSALIEHMRKGSVEALIARGEKALLQNEAKAAAAVKQRAAHVQSRAGSPPPESASSDEFGSRNEPTISDEKVEVTSLSPEQEAEEYRRLEQELNAPAVSASNSSPLSRGAFKEARMLLGSQHDDGNASGAVSDAANKGD